MSDPCSASSLKGIRPFADVDTVRIHIVIGGGLDPEQDTGPALRLFKGDLNRADEFTASLNAELETTLASCKIKVSTDDELVVSIYGRSLISPNRETYYSALVELRIIRESLNECDCSEDLEPYAIKTFLSYGSDSQAEEILVSQISAILSETADCHAKHVSATTDESADVP
jgi:hypothetical protein